MNYSVIKNCDIANGPGVRVTLFVSGCTHHCAGCFNPETWDFAYGEPFTAQVEEEILQALAPDYIAGLTLLGGEPLEDGNRQALLPLMQAVKKAYPDKTIWCYTGYLFDRDICDTFCKKWEDMRTFLSCLDVIVDGEFIQAQKNISLRFRGSENQRIIQVQESLKAGKIVLWEEVERAKDPI
ncbi:MAG: anaerobic ribonucleoside-triphosphate reductase activating protein [Bacteroidales bacterium]|nr:anaerobic ribonucleoside-triphosphate reductase activating protein [Bacteroidales bacterium]MCM1416973.1 anaerobic ribonucleoside-triphosphate reductase activating protein [bacterium]MCM1423519.1 anaerobic ribonucleoside-triphosphate reductase activating protein [bacterium]